MKNRYVVKRLDLVRMTYVYFNCFDNYKDAAEARDALQKRYGGHFEIFEED